MWWSSKFYGEDGGMRKMWWSLELCGEYGGVRKSCSLSEDKLSGGVRKVASKSESSDAKSSRKVEFYFFNAIIQNCKTKQYMIDIQKN